MIDLSPSHSTRQQAKAPISAEPSTSAISRTLVLKKERHAHARLAEGLRKRFYGVRPGMALCLLRQRIASQRSNLSDWR